MQDSTPATPPSTAATLFRLLTVTAFAAVTAGCMLPLPAFINGVERHESILVYYDWLGQADPEIVAANTERYADRYNDNGATRDGVRLALLLSYAEDSPAEDMRRARDILGDVLDSSDNEEQSSQNVPGHVRFAELWHDVLMRRLAIQQSLQEQSELNAQLRQDNQQLEQQIEALKAIEQQLNQREQIQEPPLEQPSPDSSGGR